MDVDSFRFLSPLIKRFYQLSLVSKELPVPFTPLRKPVEECRFGLVTSGGLYHVRREQPFDQEGERKNPAWGDPSYRVIPRGTRSGDIRVYHMHIDPRPAEQDLNCLLPLERLDELVAMGKVGRAAPSHYSFMGYILDPRELLAKSVPAMIEHLQADKVDVAVFIPA